MHSHCPIASAFGPDDCCVRFPFSTLAFHSCQCRLRQTLGNCYSTPQRQGPKGSVWRLKRLHTLSSRWFFLWLPFAEHFGKPLGRSVQSCLPSRLICVDTNAFQMSMWWWLCWREGSRASQLSMLWCLRAVPTTPSMWQSQWRSYAAGLRSPVQLWWSPRQPFSHAFHVSHVSLSISLSRQTNYANSPDTSWMLRSCWGAMNRSMNRMNWLRPDVTRRTFRGSHGNLEFRWLAPCHSMWGFQTFTRAWGGCSTRAQTKLMRHDETLQWESLRHCPSTLYIIPEMRRVSSSSYSSFASEVSSWMLPQRCRKRLTLASSSYGKSYIASCVLRVRLSKDMSSA